MRERERQREKETKHKAKMLYDIMSALTFCPVLAFNAICYVKCIPERNKDYV